MRIISLDPGANGAVAAIEDNWAEVHSLPECPKELFALLKTLSEGASCTFVIEKVNAMPGQGVSSTFKFGRGVGILEGSIGALGFVPSYVSAQIWTRHYPSILATKEGLVDNNARRKAGKAEALKLARAFYPDLADLLQRAKDDGRADALLIARFQKEKETK